MAYPHLPRLTRSGLTTWTGTLPCTWTEGLRPLGGGEVAASGTPANYLVRRDPLLRVLLRIHESEWGELVTFLNAVDDGGLSFTFHPDTNEVPTFTVYLDAPSVRNGEELTYTRDEGDPSVLLIALVLRRSTAAAFDLALY